MKEYNEWDNPKELAEINQIETDNLRHGIELANKYLWGLSNFKRFISQFLKTENDEDQWTFDYQSYCLWLTILKKDVFLRLLHPSNWAVEYYQDRWDIEKMNKSLESLGRIAQKSKI